MWDYIRTTRCCRNGLKFLLSALAKVLSASQDQAILLTQQQWLNCTSLFCMQDAASLSSCRFDILHRDNGGCSALTLSSVRSKYAVQFGSLIKSCSQFDVPSFLDRCANCTSEISNMIRTIVYDLHVVDDETEKAICSVATIAAIASTRIGNYTWTGDYYRCLGAMDSEDSGSRQSKSDVVKIILLTLITLMGLVLLINLIKFKTEKKPDIHKEATNVPGEVARGEMVCEWSGLYRFSKAEIEKAINYSDQKICLGRGSAGEVYQGVLPSGQLVAIKHIYETSMNSSFEREVEGLSKVRHPNLVALLGYCDESGDKYIVYEYCSNGNLAQHLLSDTLVTWQKRVKILRDCSLALRFLHTHPDGSIIHRDIKLTNILLTETMVSKLSDFGLAKMIGMKETRCFTALRGTVGYMDPEYMTTGILSCASDIFSFGIVILQLISGRKVVELDTEARETLTREAMDVSAGNQRWLKDFIDPRLEEEPNLEDFKSILSIAILCVAKSSRGRPSINDLVGEMERAYKNTSANMPAQTRRQNYTSSMEKFQSSEVIQE